MILNLNNIQRKAIVVSTNTTAVNDGNYTVVANATFTDPSPVEGKGYRVFVRNGTATINSVAYTEGTTILRLFHSGSWTSYVSLPDSNFVPTTRTINSKPLSSNIVLNEADFGYLHLDFTPSSVVTGTTSETQVGVVSIPANMLKKTLRIYTPLIKVGTAGTVTLTYKLSTSETMPSLTTDRIATYTSVNNQLWLPFQRNPSFESGVLVGLAPSVSAINDLAVGVNTPMALAYDNTQVLRLYVSVTLSNGADSVYLAGGHITNM
jgi:hypothetical protein